MSLMNKNRFMQLLESKLGNVKPLLNEYANYYSSTPTFQSGPVDTYNGKATLNLANQTFTLNQAIDCERANVTATGWELRILKGTTFKKVGNNLVSKNQNASFVDDYFGTGGKVRPVGDITISCTPSQGTHNVYISTEPKNVYYGENWNTGIRNVVKDLCSSKVQTVKPAPTIAQATTTQCTEYNNRIQTPVTANAGDIQTFLKNIGHNITVDYAFGNNTATALGKFMYGQKAGINSVAKLWEKMKASGLDVGTNPGFGIKMATAAAKWINGAIPKLVKSKCVKSK